MRKGVGKVEIISIFCLMRFHHYLHNGENLRTKLGNINLLSRKKNSTASSYDFEKKKAAYFTKGGICSFALTIQVLRRHT
jgi:hypothetical protein